MPFDGDIKEFEKPVVETEAQRVIREARGRDVLAVLDRAYELAGKA